MESNKVVKAEWQPYVDDRGYESHVLETSTGMVTKSIDLHKYPQHDNVWKATYNGYELGMATLGVMDLATAKRTAIKVLEDHIQETISDARQEYGALIKLPRGLMRPVLRTNSSKS